MKLYLVKPDLLYYEQYNKMMDEWVKDGSKIAPWFLDDKLNSIDEFAEFVKMLDNYENANLPDKFATTTSYFVIDENDKLIGASSLRHYLTVEGLNSWGHIGYGVRPSERNKGYGTQILNLTLGEARRRNIRKVLLGAHKSNVGSCKVIEKCGGKFYREIYVDNDDLAVIQYIIWNK